jgi:exonuclease 1
VPPSKSSCTSDNEKAAAGPPDISAFAYRPVKTSGQGKIITGNAINAPLDPGTFAYRPMASTVCCTERSKFTDTTVGTVDTPPDLSTFAYKPTKTAVRRTEGSRLAGVTLKALRGTSRSQFKK